MSKTKAFYTRRVEKDVALIVLATVCAVFLVQSGILSMLLFSLGDAWPFGAFIVGILFTSGFTIVPATIALATLSQSVPAAPLILWGALGSVAGDLVLFFFVRDIFSEDLLAVAKRSQLFRSIHAPKAGIAHYLFSFVGAIIVASPLPDEIGLFMMGFSKMKTRYIVPLLFALDLVAVGFVVWIAHIFH